MIVRASHFSVLVFAAALFLPRTNSAAEPGWNFEKLLVFAETNRARIEVRLSTAEPLNAFELYGRIVHAGSGQRLWEGSLGKTNLPAGTTTFRETVRNVTPQLWSPDLPNLYTLSVRAGDAPEHSISTRFGFRTMEIRDGRFHLNGKPIFLRGIAINPPGRTIPDAVAESRAFAEDYVRCLKAKNVNIFRLSTDGSQTWFDVCDELGMMQYAGRYGAPPNAEEGKRAAPKDFARSIAGYRDLFETYVNHPSIVMYYLSNELPVSGKRGEEFSALLTEAHQQLKNWDPTRPYIGNAGYGEGREGDVCDVHRYWGWYYNSFLTYYNLRDKLVPTPLYGDPAKNQPLTFTECVGSFTGASGEFNLIRSKQLAPRLGWIGHTDAPTEDALRYQCFMVKHATESFRRMRPHNPRLAGIMPFTIFFYNWSGISSFDQMQPKPALEQLAISYQPVLLSWECWTPQVYAGATLQPRAHIVNDNDAGEALENPMLHYRIVGADDRAILRGTQSLGQVPHFAARCYPLNLSIPEDTPTGGYLLCGSVQEGGRVVSTNWTSLFIAGKDWRLQSLASELSNTIPVYDPNGETIKALKICGIRPQSVSDLTEHLKKPGRLIIGEWAWDNQLATNAVALKHFVRLGGRLLCLAQDRPVFDPDWLPARILMLESSANEPNYPPRTRPFREQMNINPERPDHPAFAGLNRHRFSLWSDYSGWDESKPGFPKVYPVTAGFRLLNADDLPRTAILADYDRGLEGLALAEFFDGKGSVIFSGFDLVRRAGLDPVAERLLGNLAAFLVSASGHEALPLVNKPIRWGDFPSEQGTVCGSLNGLLVNARWLRPKTNPQAPPMPDNTGAWNMAPGDQFVPFGRNPFGAYGYSTASSLRDHEPDARSGSGFFHARIPPGKSVLITKAMNPATLPATLDISINALNQEEAKVIAPGATETIHTSLPPGETNLCVLYAGPKTLVLLETAFE